MNELIRLIVRLESMLEQAEAQVTQLTEQKSAIETELAELKKLHEPKGEEN